jgi:hypothetical protein
MTKLPLNEVRWLTIEEIAQFWAEERGTLSSVIRRELQLALINWDRLQKGQNKIDVLPSEEERPPISTEISREQMEEFCAKQKWPTPAFWFRRETRRSRGRPSHQDSILKELRRIAAGGQLEQTLAAQCQYLEEWAAANCDPDPPKAASIENIIRHEYKMLKASR